MKQWLGKVHAFPSLITGAMQLWFLSHCFIDLLRFRIQTCSCKQFALVHFSLMQPTKELSASLRQWLRHTPKWVLILNSFLLTLNHIIVPCIHHRKVESCGSQTHCSRRGHSWAAKWGCQQPGAVSHPVLYWRKCGKAKGFLTVQCEQSQA